MPTEAEIQNYAYKLWEKAGCPEGRDDEFWQAARVELNAESEDAEPSIEEQPNRNSLPG